ncbi:protein arginine N-methyltransferase 7-like [Bolinopsis microptera]|uniref:protein arginine N-methyltransferase 7-like n=1 Tax=Bolinopsis microptera TaxID=2820187 RepID=UPI00307A39A6
MLNDTHRHKAYRSAIQTAIKKIHSRGEAVCMLDIGTGTGLLALYAAEAGADFIVACESNKTMANIAKGVIKDNENMYKKTCKIVVEIMSSCDLDKFNSGYRNSFNLIVSEVYDSELIGEGCLLTYKHALSQLASGNCIFIPSRATLFAQPVFSASLDSYCSLPSSKESQQRTNISFDVPWEVHVDKISDLKSGAPVELWQWEFNLASVECWTGARNISITNKELCNGIVVWWRSDIDEDNVISTAPKPLLEFQEFRDHWMPLVYCMCYNKGDISLQVNITDLEVQIDHSGPGNFNNCVCSKKDNPGEMLSYRYLGYMNCCRLNAAYCGSVCELLKTDDKSVVYIGPPSTLPALLSKNLSCKVKTIRVSDTTSELKVKEGTIVVDSCYHPFSTSELKVKEGTIVVDSCYHPFSTSELKVKEGTIVVDSCYHPFSLTCVSYYYRRELLEQSLSSHCSLVPRKVVLSITLVESCQLANRMLSPDTIDGFNMSGYSELVRQCQGQLSGDDMFDPIHLWEYDYTTLSTPTQLPSLQQCDDNFTSTLPITQRGLVTNAVFSLGYYFGDSLLEFGNSDYFNKVDCFTLVDDLRVQSGDKVIVDFQLRNCQIVSLLVYKS